MPKTKHLRSSPPWPAPHLCTWRRPGGRTFRRHRAVSKTSRVWHGAWKHTTRSPRAHGQDFNDGPPRVIGQDGRAHIMQSHPTAVQRQRRGVKRQRFHNGLYFRGRRRPCRDGGGGVGWSGFPTTYSTTPSIILHPTLPTSPPTLPLTVWGVVRCCIDGNLDVHGMHARPLWLGLGVCVAVGRRACHPAGEVDEQGIMAS